MWVLCIKTVFILLRSIKETRVNTYLRYHCETRTISTQRIVVVCGYHYNIILLLLWFYNLHVSMTMTVFVFRFIHVYILCMSIIIKKNNHNTCNTTSSINIVGLFLHRRQSFSVPTVKNIRNDCVGSWVGCTLE
jgi:hypothetical protein